MNTPNEKAITPKVIEKEISQLLSKKFGDRVSIVSPVTVTQNVETDPAGLPTPPTPIDFHLRPEDLVAFLDQSIVKQDLAKTVLR